MTCLVYRWQAKSQCNPSSLEINSLEKVNPGMRPLFFNQKMEQKEPEKKIPSTAAKAIIAERVTLLVTALTKATAAKRVYQFSFLRTHGVAQNLERLNIVSILT